MCSNPPLKSASGPCGNTCGDSSKAPTTCASGFCASDNNVLPQHCRTRMVEPDKLMFTVEWFDREAELVKKYLLIFYTVDGTTEVVDLVKRCRFLKRMKLSSVTLEELYIGNVLNIYSRPMTITEYGDSCTIQFLEPKSERAFLLVKPEAVERIGCILQSVEKCFRVIRARMVKMSFEMASKIYEYHEGKEYFSTLINHMSSAPVIAFLLVAENAIAKLNNLVGETDPADAKMKHPLSLRALYGHDFIHNGFHVAESPDCVTRDAAFFFAKTRSDLACIAPNTALLKCTTCCVIKPHAVKEKLAGRIISDIQNCNFKITAMEMFYLDRTHAEEFYEIYKGVVGEYSDMTYELALGPCYALEIFGCSEETPTNFRQIVGPHDPELARQVRPQTLRARYGLNKVHNAVHCTDLSEDAHMELEYFFRLLHMKS